MRDSPRSTMGAASGSSGSEEFSLPTPTGAKFGSNDWLVLMAFPSSGDAQKATRGPSGGHRVRPLRRRTTGVDDYGGRMPEHAVTTRSSSTLGLVLGSQLYRRATVSLFFAGLGVSVALPQLSLFLVQDLHASLPVAGLFFLTNLAAPVLGFVVGRWSDRLTDRLSLFKLGAVVGLVGWVAMAFTTEVSMAFLVNLTVLGFAGATGSLIFAAVRDELTHTPTGADNRVMSTVRLGFSVGFMTGPVLGSVLGGVAGLRLALIAAGVCTLLQAVPMIGQTVTRAVPDQVVLPHRAAGRNASPPSLLPLVTFLGLSVLAMCGDTIRFAYLPIYMEMQLGTPDWLRGVVISVQSVGMLVFMPLMGVLADRFGAHRLVVD